MQREMTRMELKTARRMNHLKASEIREILKLAEKPEVISFAGGLPAPELLDRKSTRLNSSHVSESRMPSSA